MHDIQWPPIHADSADCHHCTPGRATGANADCEDCWSRRARAIEQAREALRASGRLWEAAGSSRPVFDGELLDADGPDALEGAVASHLLRNGFEPRRWSGELAPFEERATAHADTGEFVPCPCG